jgi:hypothetical protein
MEHNTQSPEKAITDKQEVILSFSEQLSLAQHLVDAVNKRNDFIKNQGGFDTFAEAGQHVAGGRASYDALEQKVTDARKQFDEQVLDKKAFITRLRSVNESDLADTISSMFTIPKGNIFSRLFKK